jgi:hypothetical protein
MVKENGLLLFKKSVGNFSFTLGKILKKLRSIPELRVFDGKILTIAMAGQTAQWQHFRNYR